MNDPFSVSREQCAWFLCTTGADMSYQRRGARLCREHALFVWSIVDEQMRESQLTRDDLVARREAVEAEKEAELQRRVARRTVSGYVYYLRVGEHIKIGYASNLFQRLSSYPPGSVLLAVEVGTLQVEAQRHREFADLLAAGREWFEPGPRLMDLIEGLASKKTHVHFTGWEKRPARTRRERARGFPTSEAV